jgi:hypothetical protein
MGDDKMLRLKPGTTIVGLLLALAVMTAGASAAVNLPDLSITLAGGTYPIHTQATVANSDTLIVAAAGTVLEGEGLTLLTLTTELSALGTFTADLTKIHESGTAKLCNTASDREGVVLMAGEFHLVPTSLSPLTLGILYLVTSFVIFCEFNREITVRGNMLSSLNGIGSEATELTRIGAKLEGKQGVSEYFNDGGTKIKAKLEIEAGAGFAEAGISAEGELGLTVLGSQMIVITNR